MVVDTLVFVPGWGSLPAIWQSQRDYFSKNYKVILPDISASRSIKEAADIVNGGINTKAGIVLIGWSLGWLVILELLKSFPVKPKGLVCVNSTPKFVDDGYLGAGPTKTHLAKMIRDCRNNPQKTLEGFYRSMLSRIGEEMFSRLSLKNFNYGNLIYGLKMLEVSDYRKFIKDIRAPTLIIAGKKDTICPQEASIYMHKQIIDSQLKILDCGHIPFLTNAQEFNRLIEDFVKSLVHR